MKLAAPMKLVAPMKLAANNSGARWLDERFKIGIDKG
jgi:hypothetical protein